MSIKKVLSVGVPKAELGSVSKRLRDASGYEVEEAPTCRSALNLLAEIPFDLIVVAHPRPDLEPKGFLDALRSEGSASRQAKVLLVTEDPTHADLGQLRQRAFEIVPRDETLLEDLTSQALEGDPRVAVSVMVRLSAELPYGRSIRICQSENLSRSGMLIRTEDTLPVGTPVEAEFSLPGQNEPIEIEGKVVRMTVPGEIPGIALNFERLRGGSRHRLETFLEAE
ncbi:MAG: PilZ domain-containing protein [Thermoanaerobaculia bacterium]|nr:PilZ domain-containing protein [Thermoanaerobaculia bacterium]